MAEPKTKRTKESVAAFLATIEDDAKRKDAKAIVKLRADVSGEKPAMWGPAIVGFGSYKAGANDWPVIGFSPRKANLTLYGLAGFPGRDALAAKLGKHKTGKGCLYINKFADIDERVLSAMIAAALKHMAAKHG